MAPYHFCTGFNQFWYKDNLEKLGCKVEECVANGDFYDYLRQEVTRMPFVTKKYKGRASLYMKVRCAMFAHFLKKFIATEDKSDELICFGYMVLARKN